jgi:hypothetical protein
MNAVRQQKPQVTIASRSGESDPLKVVAHGTMRMVERGR